MAMKLLIVITTLALHYAYEYQDANILEQNTFRKQQNTRFVQQRTPGMFHKGRMVKTSRAINVDGSNSMKLSGGKLGYNSNRIKEQAFNVGTLKRIAFKKQQKMDFKRVRRETTQQNTTEQSLQCEVASLSCRNCCENSNNCPHKTNFCRCDSLCTFYNDCCVDFQTFCGTRKEISFGGVDPQQLSCMAPRHVDTRSRESDHIWMVNKCPKNRKIDDISRNCETADDIKLLNITTMRKLLPVVDKNTNLLFRNEFCAQCNGIEKFEYFGFNMRCYVVPPATITSFEELVEFAKLYCETKEFISIFRDVHQAVRECIQYFRYLCPTLKELNEKCDRYILSTYHCISITHWCNLNISKWDGLAYDRCMQSSESLSDMEEGPTRIEHAIASFTVVLRLSKGAPVAKVQGARCRNGLFYDPYLETCRYGESISQPLKENIDRFDVVVWLDIRNFETLLSIYWTMPTLNETISSLTQLFNFKYSQVSALQYISIETVKRPETQIMRFKLELTNEQTLRLGKATNNTLSHFEKHPKNSTNYLPLQRLLFFSGKFNITVSNEIVTVFKTTSRQLACIRKNTFLQGNYTSVQNGKYYFINSTGKTFARNQVFLGENKSISVCERIVFSTCVGRRINLTSDEYVKFENLSISYNRTKTIYDFGEYDIEDGKIFMCIPEEPSELIHAMPSDSVVIETYLTLICLGLSLASLFLVIQTYLIFAELRNLPGKNLLSLSLSLFLVQLLWLIPDAWYPSTLCLVVAVLKHYLFLVSFVAMAAIAWDSYSVFASKDFRKDSASTKPENKKFYKYSAIVWGLPAMSVGACAVVDQKNIYAVYVNELWCWFDNIQAQKYLFVAPVGLLLLFNVTFFALTVFCMQRSHSRTRLILSDESHKTMFWIYLKLSALMGFSWLFGFIYLLWGTPVFSYLFVIFASLQGVYIALAFVVKKSVWEKYKKLFGRQNKYQPDYRRNLCKSKETRV